MYNCIIKWTGSKKSQSKEIIKYFPKQIDTYYEPFIGGGSVLYELLNSDIKVKKYVCSDINLDLINLWNSIKSNHIELIKMYTKLWNELNKDKDLERQKEYYLYIRREFNLSKNPLIFMFLTRTCMNGLIRYNKKGEFNTSLHLNRPGIHPNKLEKIINHWNELLNKFHIMFINIDYVEVRNKRGDFMYLDPPYFNTKGMYFGTINLDDFLSWLKNSNCGYLLSYDGLRGSIDKTQNIPIDLYDKHIYIDSGVSSFSRLIKKENISIKESLYIKYK